MPYALADISPVEIHSPAGLGGYKGAGAKGKFAAGPQPAAGYVARDMKSDRGEMSASKYASKKKQRDTPPASSTG